MAVTFALLAMLAPCALDAASAVHLALDDHHDEAHGRPPASPPASGHGHGHAAGTPGHDHGTTAAAPTIPGAEAPGLAADADGVSRIDVSRVPSRPSEGAAPSPSPPAVTTTILRV